MGFFGDIIGGVGKIAGGLAGNVAGLPGMIIGGGLGGQAGGALSKLFGFGGGADGPNTGPYMGNPDINQYGNDPGSSALQASLNSMPEFQNINAPQSNFTANGYQAKDMSGAVLPQYDAMRTRLNSQYSQLQGQSQDALDRQFAAAGGGPGNGAQAKQTENLAAAIAKQKGEDSLGIDAQEGQTRFQLQQQENQNAFTSGETQKGYGFQSGQDNLARQFSANQFNAQMGQNANQFKFDANAKIAALNTDWKKAQADAVSTEYNKQLSDFQAKHSGGLLGGGGFLGTGIGA